MIKELFKGGLALAALVALSNLATPVQAADLGFPPAPPPLAPVPVPVVVAPAPSYPCYFRADIGASWDVDDFDGDYNGPTTENDIDEGWFAEAGIGCGSPTLHGLRAELVFGFRDERDLSAEPPEPPLPGDPLITTIESYTMMANFYYDFGNHRGLIPYVGAGVGLAYHEMDDVYCTVEIPFFCDPTVAQAGDEDVHFAWSVMAGVGYEVGDRVILDVGYRYMDLGDVSSERADSGFSVNPFFNVNNLEMHEVKAGVRYRFGVLGH